MTETTIPGTLKDIYARYRELAPVPDPEGTGTAWHLSRYLLVNAVRANARAEYEVLNGGGLSMSTLAELHGCFAAVHVLEGERIVPGNPTRSVIAAAEIAEAIRDGGGIGEWLWEHSRHLGIDINEVTRLAEAEARLKAASAGEPGKQHDTTRDALRQTARTLDGLCLTLSAAMVEYRQNGAEAAMKWIITATEDWDESGARWDGKETARAYYDRLHARRYVNDDPDKPSSEPGTCPVYRPVADGSRLYCTLPESHNDPEDAQRSVHVDSHGDTFRVARCQQPLVHGLPHGWCAIPEHHLPLDGEAGQ